MEKDERDKARIASAKDRMPKDASTLIDGHDIAAVVDVVKSLIRRAVAAEA